MKLYWVEVLGDQNQKTSVSTMHMALTLLSTG